MDDGLAIDVGNEGRQAFLEFVFGADADMAQDRTRQLCSFEKKPSMRLSSLSFIFA